jgi:Mce-associated membrane protein
MLDVSNGNRGSDAVETAVDPASQPTTDVAPEPTPVDREVTAGTAVKALLSSPGRWIKKRGRVVVLALVITGLVIALLSTDLKLRHQEALTSARTSAVAAAKADAIELASYDYRHLDQDFGTVRQHSSPSFQASFSQSSNALASVLARYHATAVASIVSAGVVSATTTRAVVLVFLVQTVTNTTQRSGPQKDQSRIQMTLVRNHGHWLIDQVQLL